MEPAKFHEGGKAGIVDLDSDGSFGGFLMALGLAAHGPFCSSSKDEWPLENAEFTGNCAVRYQVCKTSRIFVGTGHA